MKENHWSFGGSSRRWLVIISLVLLSPCPGIALTPPPMNWHQMSGGGSKVVNARADRVEMSLVRKTPGDKRDVENQGYAYVLSQGIPLPDDWRRITVEGEWWRAPGRSRNFQEMVMYLFGRYPCLMHGKSLDGRELTHYLGVAYDTWNKVLRFEDRGGEKAAVIRRIHRMIPLQPAGFQWLVIRDPDSGMITWEFYERRQGEWQLLHRRKNTRFLDTNRGKLYWKLGGWVTWEKPVSSSIRFQHLSYRVITAGESAKSSGPEGTHSGDVLAGHGGCFENLPLPRGATAVRDLPLLKVKGLDRLKTLARQFGGEVRAYRSDDKVAKVAEYYKHHGVKGWRRVLNLAAGEGGTFVYEKGELSQQILVLPESGKTLILVGCGPKLGAARLRELPPAATGNKAGK